MREEESNVEKYSSIGSALSVLAREVSPGRAERFLLELANLKITDATSRSRFEQSFSDFIPPTPGRLYDVTESPPSQLYEVISFPRFIFTLQHLLRAAWERPTTFDREVHLGFTTQEVYKQFLRATDMKPAEDTPLHALWKPLGKVFICLTRAQRVADRMRRCDNASCPAPYFIAERRNQKFCTEICAAPAQREQKATWWKEHGPEWREKRKKQKLKSGKRRRS
jgi:hypothetical protein